MSRMTLQQLRYLLAIAQNGLNVTAAAHKLRTSQPAVSRQIKQLERELGFHLFARSGRALTDVTPAGEQVLASAMQIARAARNIRRFSEERRQLGRDELSIGTTHTQARYVLPPVVQRFTARHPQVQLHLHQGTSE
jgi:LysR family transcriptional regulator, cys regulon transcriptional activator